MTNTYEKKQKDNSDIFESCSASVKPEKELCGLSANFLIDVSVSDLYIPSIGPHTVFSYSRIGRQIVGIYKNRSQTHECGNWD
jgi:hypothetical protein